MSNKIGRFEIISQAAKSSFATLYKAKDTESQQTIALKVVALSQVLDRAKTLPRRLAFCWSSWSSGASEGGG